MSSTKKKKINYNYIFQNEAFFIKISKDSSSLRKSPMLTYCMTNSLCYVLHNLTLLCVPCWCCDLFSVIYYYISILFYFVLNFYVLCLLYLFVLYVTELLVIRVNPFSVIVAIIGFTRTNVLGSVSANSNF